MRTSLIRVGLCWLALLTATPPSGASTAFPTEPVRIVLPVAAGAAGDLVVRRLTDQLARTLGQPVIVENRPGGSGIIAAEAVAMAKPNGYTILWGAMNIFCINPHMFARLPYDPARAFTPVALALRASPVLVVGPSVPSRTLHEFVAYAKARPGKITIGSPGEGSMQHLAAALLEQTAEIQLSHVQYKSNQQEMLDLMAGHIDAALDYGSVVSEHVKSGRMRALVVAGVQRKPALPHVPTAAEAGVPALNISAWGGFVAPRGTPPERVAVLNKALSQAVEQPAFADWLANLGSEVMTGSPEHFASFMEAESSRCARLLKDLGIQPR